MLPSPIIGTATLGPSQIADPGRFSQPLQPAWEVMLDLDQLSAEKKENWAWKSVFYYENIEDGHSGAANNKQAAYMQAPAFTFLWKQLN